MKLNPFTCTDESKNKSDSRFKRDQNAAKIDFAIKSAMDEFGDIPERRRAFMDVVACVRHRTRLLKPTEGQGTPGWLAPVFLINRLKNLAQRQSHWIRSCESWHPWDVSVRPAFRSLAHHLLCNYTVPEFMDSAWDPGAGPEAFRCQSWFIRLGRGASFRSLNLPIVLTREMEHFVRQAPDHYTVEQALRYGETRGLNGTERLAREVAAGRLGQRIERPEFWRMVIAFLAHHPELDPNDVNPIVDFMHANKFASDEVCTNAGLETRSAPWPDFSIKGRSLKSLQRLVDAWHAELAISKAGNWVSWPASGIRAYRFVEKQPGAESDQEWAVLELLDSGALHSEGRMMHHCVYSYATRCHRGETTIWSLRLRTGGQAKRMVTIEVDPRKKSIVQVRAKCNRWPGPRSREIINQWADWAGLRVEV